MKFQLAGPAEVDTEFEAANEKREAEIKQCPGHLWVIHVYEDEEDGVDLLCSRCPASEGDLYDDLFELAEGVVSEDPEISVEQLKTDPNFRGSSYPVNVKIRGYQHFEGDWDVEITISPRVESVHEPTRRGSPWRE